MVEMHALTRQKPSGDEAALLAKRASLAEARLLLAESEAALAQLRAKLGAFEARYLREVGLLYAELDEWEARLAEREAALAGTDAAHEAAREARQRATDTRDAQHEAEEQAEAEQRDAAAGTAELKALYREVARRIHPDFARDAAEEAYLHVLMTRANQAYERGDSAALQRLLDDYLEIGAAARGETPAAELLRLSRQLHQAQRDLAALEQEQVSLLGSELAQLFQDAEQAAAQHRDLLRELAAGIGAQVAAAEARYRAAEAAGIPASVPTSSFG